MAQHVRVGERRAIAEESPRQNMKIFRESAARNTPAPAFTSLRRVITSFSTE